MVFHQTGMGGRFGRMDQRGGLSEGGLEKDLFVHQFPKDDDDGDNIAINSDIVNDDYSDIDDDFPLT